MSRLQDLLDEYLAVRRALGYKLEREGWVLPRFVAFVESHGTPSLTTALALEWVTHRVPTTPDGAARRLAMIRGFAAYVHAQDPRTDVPPPDLVPRRRSQRRIYLYSDADLAALLNACARLHRRLGRATYRTLFGLLAVTGMRVGEAIALDRADVDAHGARLIIRHTKFNKSREVPLHTTTVAALHAYAQARNRALPHPQSPSFFLSATGKRLLPQNVWQTFARLRRVAGLPQHPHRPRIHDLRHSFAMQTLLRWSRDGEGVHARMPLLSTYLGHVSPSMTYWYLTATPALLERAAERVTHWGAAGR